jgi:hypothetical protein
MYMRNIFEDGGDIDFLISYFNVYTLDELLFSYNFATINLYVLLTVLGSSM